MKDSKADQSFSSYSQEENNEPHPSEDDKFSEYEERTHQKIESSGHTDGTKDKYGQKRRYSYGKIEQRGTTYNYLSSLNQFPNTKPTSFTSNLQIFKQFKYGKGLGSPCGVGAFESPALEEYEKCYLSGLSKYYKSNTIKNKKQAREITSVSTSLDKNKSLDRSEYWNGLKFEYLAQREVQRKQKEFENKKKEQNNKRQTRNEVPRQSFQRNVASGLIINKKAVMENKINQNEKHKNKRDSSTYIRIQEDFSNSKNCSEIKMSSQKQHAFSDKKTQEALSELPLKQNIGVFEKDKQNPIKSEEGKSFFKEFRNMEQEYSAILTEKNKLIRQNQRLRSTLLQKNSQIQRLTGQRVKDNEEYTKNIQKLKILFQNQKNSMMKEFTEQIDIYKCVRKQALKNELIKEQEERINIIVEKNRIQNQLERVLLQLQSVKEELADKNSKLSILEKKFFSLQKRSHTQNQKINELNKVIEKKDSESAKNQYKVQEKIESQSKETQQVPEWIHNFLSVFKNMVKKLINQVDSSWSEKKIVIVGWKILKIVIEKAVKLGIKIPEVVNQNEEGDCSIISYPCIDSNETKKYNLTGSKRPLRN